MRYYAPSGTRQTASQGWAIRMAADEGIFDWVRFPQGRARFAGGVRGAEQSGHDTFAVELGGIEYFGEIKNIWPDREHFNLEVVSFGHHMLENIGMPMNATSPFIAKFTSDQLRVVQALILGLVETFAKRMHRPAIMHMEDESQFLGEVTFANGWALTAPGN